MTLKKISFILALVHTLYASGKHLQSPRIMTFSVYQKLSFDHCREVLIDQGPPLLWSLWDQG